MKVLTVKCVMNVAPSCKVLYPASLQLLQVAGITTAGGKPRARQYKAFDYRKKFFRFIDQPFDRTLRRMDENSKVIVVDGPLASGKNEFAKRLAKELDFKYVPQSDPRKLHTCGEYGLSYYDLDELLPKHLRYFDLKQFLSEPQQKVSEGGGKAGGLQIDFFTSRLYTYNDALLHLLSTGQGVVCVRSPWSDQIFARALFENGFMSRNAYRYYKNIILFNHLCDFPRPHLTIYLDADVAQTKQNILSRNDPLEVNSSVFTDSFIQSMENEYKDVVLPELETHSPLLIYPSIPDISDHEIETMVEDIEALGDLKHSGLADDPLLQDWELMTDEELAFKRREYQNLRQARLIETHDRPWNCPEILIDDNMLVDRHKIYDYVPGYQYEAGYDPKLVPKWKVFLGISGFQKSPDRRKFWIPA